jgi:hypothetical protein
MKCDEQVRAHEKKQQKGTAQIIIPTPPWLKFCEEKLNRGRKMKKKRRKK